MERGPIEVPQVVSREVLERVFDTLKSRDNTNSQRAIVAGRLHLTSPLGATWLQSAATMADFSPEQFGAEAKFYFASRTTVDGAATDGIVRRLSGSSNNPRYTLELSVRRKILRELGSEENILSAAKSGQPDVIASTIVELISGELMPIDSLPRSKLASLAVVQRWLDGLITNLPSQQDIASRLALADLTAPLEKLVSRGFVGRARELLTLSDYVGILSETSLGGQLRRFVHRTISSIFSDPPLMIYGPGGVGKSTLIAKFLLEHVREASTRASFVYLDFDRANIRDRDPMPMILEIVRQLSVQVPALRDVAEQLRDSVAESSNDEDADGYFRSYSDSPSEIYQAAATLGSLLPRDTPVVVVLDTLEEVQYLGSHVVIGYLQALDILQRSLPQLRLVMSGRAPVDRSILKTVPIPLEGFDPESSADFFRKYLLARAEKLALTSIASENITDEMTTLVSRAAGGSPLVLALAAENLLQCGPQWGLDDTSAIVKFVQQVDADRIQAGLYGRILDHIHDNDVKAIAYPGLVLRRLDPDVILRVLTKPCGLSVRDTAQAAELFRRVEKEMSLVDVDDTGRGVRHRTDLRRLMLKDIASSVEGAKLKMIERRAISYYKRLYDLTLAPRDRAEQLYHMMRLSYRTSVLNSLWVAGVEPFLVSAPEEVPPNLRVWLLQRLNRGVEGDELAHANQSEWEQVVERRARQLIRSGNPQLARREIFGRDPTTWLKGGPMFLLAAECLFADNQESRSLVFADQAIQNALEAGNGERAAHAALFAATICESTKSLAGAIERLRALDARRALLTPELELRILMAKTRVLSGMGALADERDVRASAMLLLDDEMIASLRDKASLLRDAAAVLGADKPELVQLALQTVGLDLGDPAAIELAVAAIEAWDVSIAGSPIPKPPIGDAVLRTRPVLFALGGGEQGLSDVRAWLRRSGPKSAATIAALLDRYPMPQDVNAKLAQLYGVSITRAIKRKTTKRKRK